MYKHSPSQSLSGSCSIKRVTTIAGPRFFDVYTPSPCLQHAFWFHIYLFPLLHSPYFTCWTPISCSFQSQVSSVSASSPYFRGFFLFMNLLICFSLEFHSWLVVSPIESSHSPKAALLRTGWAMATFGAPFRRSYGQMLTGRWRMQRETSHGGSISSPNIGVNQAETNEMMV